MFCKVAIICAQQSNILQEIKKMYPVLRLFFWIVCFHWVLEVLEMLENLLKFLEAGLAPQERSGFGTQPGEL